MIKFEYTIQEEVGIHARPASKLVTFATPFKSNISIERNGKTADVKRLISLMALGVKFGENITFSIQGEDEAIAAKELEKFCRENL